MRRIAMVFGLLLLLPNLLLAQADRFELGERLRRFERAWDQSDEAGKRRAVDPLLKATTAFFSFRLGEAGRSLDLARLALRSADAPTKDALWAESLHVVPAACLLDTSEKSLPLKLAAFYKVEGDAPVNAALRIALTSADGKTTFAETTAALAANADIALAWKTPIPAGDHRLRVEITRGLVATLVGERTVSFSADLTKRLTALRKGYDALPSAAATTERETLYEHLQLLASLAERKPLETSYPADRLLKESEELLTSVRDGVPYYDAARSGEFWQRLVTAKGKPIVRIAVPANLPKNAKVPLVVALHGAGGSENMFFDGYGDGAVVKLALQRGWIVVAPRSPVFSFAPNTAELVDALAKRYPIDPNRVFVVGHSMGAGQALAAVQQSPDRFAAVAALGGGSRLAKAEAVKKVPFFVAAGAKDFALGGARQLRDSLKKADADRVVYHEYPDVEHLVVVQRALPEVFALFDEIVGKR
jgi:predicted esterase